jgi:hypothetical protein
MDRGLLMINHGHEVIVCSQNPLNVAVVGKQPHLGIFASRLKQKETGERTNSLLSKTGVF